MNKIKNPFAGLEEQGYNCFGCCQENPFGLKMEFYEDGDDVVSVWTPRDEYQSWIKTLHGGIQATLMDELGGWLVNRKLQTAGMTIQLNMKYRNPVPTGDDVRVELRGRIKEMRRNCAFIEAELRCGDKLCSSCDMIYFCVSQQKAAEEFHFNGCELEE